MRIESGNVMSVLGNPTCADLAEMEDGENRMNRKAITGAAQ